MSIYLFYLVRVITKISQKLYPILISYADLEQIYDKFT